MHVVRPAADIRPPPRWGAGGGVAGGRAVLPVQRQPVEERRFGRDPLRRPAAGVDLGVKARPPPTPGNSLAIAGGIGICAVPGGSAGSGGGGDKVWAGAGEQPLRFGFCRSAVKAMDLAGKCGDSARCMSFRQTACGSLRSEGIINASASWAVGLSTLRIA